MLVHSHVKTGPGAWTDAPPWFPLSIDSSPEALGRHVRTVLDSSGVGGADEYGSALAEKYRLLGVTLERELMQGAQYVSVRCNDERIFVTPTENGINLWHENFRHLTEQTFNIPRDSSDQAIGEAIHAGFSRCR